MTPKWFGPEDESSSCPAFSKAALKFPFAKGGFRGKAVMTIPGGG